jgi:hypothetical protein
MGKLKNKRQELSTPQYFAEDFTYPQSQSVEATNSNLARVHSGPVTGMQTSQQFADARAATGQPYSDVELQQHQLTRSLSDENPMSYSQQDMRQSQPFRTVSHDNPAERPSMYGLPPGSQPRRSYEFLGGQEPRRRTAE